MPEEQETQYGVSSVGKIPQVRVRIVDINNLFKTFKSDAPIDYDFVWLKDLDKKELQSTLPGEIYKDSEIGCITLKPNFIAENTRISSDWQPVENRNKDEENSEEEDKKPTQGYDSNLDYIVTDFATKHEGMSSMPNYPVGYTIGQHEFTPTDFLEAYIYKDGGLYKWLYPSKDAVWNEVSPPRESQIIRIAQESTKPWVITSLKSKYNWHANPELYVEIEKKKPPIEQKIGATMSAFLYDYQESSWYGATIKVTDPWLCVQIGSDSSKMIQFQFASGKAPVAVSSEYSYTISEKNKGPVVNLAKDDKFSIQFRFIPVLDSGEDAYGQVKSKIIGGYYRVTSEILSEPWDVKFYKSNTIKRQDGSVVIENIPVYSNIPSAPVSVMSSGLGVHTLAVSPVRFGTLGTIAWDLNSGKTGGVYGVISNDMWLGDKKNCSFSMTQGPEQRDVKGIIHWGGELTAETKLDLRTPYIYRSQFELVTDEDNIEPDEGDELEGIRRISIVPKIENVYKIRTNGEIELTNFNGEWDDVKGNKGVIIEYKYYNEELEIPPPDDEEEEDEEEQEEENPDETSYTLGWKRVFTGYMTNPRHIRKSFGEKYVIFELHDRLYGLERIRLINSPYFDGTNWLKSFKKLLKYGGFKEHEVLVDKTFADSGLAGYSIPYAPNFYWNPQYRFAFGTSLTKALDELHKLTRTFFYIDEYGRARIYGPAGFLNRETITFYGNSEDVPQEPHNERYNVLSSFDYSVDTDSIRNVVVCGGPNWDAKNANSFGIMYKMVDVASIEDVNAFNYLGFEAMFTFFKVWLAKPNMVAEKVRDYWERARYPIQSVSWVCPFYGLHRLYNPVKFVDPTIEIPSTYIDEIGEEQEQKFWLTQSTFEYDASKLSLHSKMEATFIRGLTDAAPGELN